MKNTKKEISVMANQLLRKEILLSGDGKENQLIKELADAIEYIHSYKGKHVAERLRDGYIGKIKINKNGLTSIQNTRGKPYGTIVAVPTEDNIVIGVSYITKDEMDFPIIGEYLALKRALEGKEKNKTSYERKSVITKAKAQVEHFEKRSLAYYHPEIYSYSRGIEGKKVVYDNYEEIHARQQMILGKK